MYVTVLKASTTGFYKTVLLSNCRHFKSGKKDKFSFGREMPLLYKENWLQHAVIKTFFFFFLFFQISNDTLYSFRRVGKRSIKRKETTGANNKRDERNIGLSLPFIIVVCLV